MKQSFVITILFVALMVGSCSKDDSGTTGPSTQEGSDYFPFEVGRQWTYNSLTYLPDGSLEPGGSYTITMTVFQKDQLFGGQPNATVMQFREGNSQPLNGICYVEPTKLWAYRGTSPTPPTYDNNWLYWSPGSYASSIMIGVGESNKFFIYGWTGTGAFIITRTPNAAIMSASILGADTLLVQGVAVGATALTLGQTGTSDTMLVLVNVVKEIAAFGPSASPWMPIMQVSSSMSEQEMCSWDSTFIFKKQNGTILREHIRYRVTTKFVQNETVSAAGGSINTEKHQLQLTMSETIDSTVASTTYPVFDGLSGQFVGDLWIAQKIGFVKMEFSGVSIFSGNWDVHISGYENLQGVFVGGFESPVMHYSCYLNPDGSGWEYLTVNKQAASSRGKRSFVLVSKNF